MRSRSADGCPNFKTPVETSTTPGFSAAVAVRGRFAEGLLSEQTMRRCSALFTERKKELAQGFPRTALVVFVDYSSTGMISLL